MCSVRGSCRSPTKKLGKKPIGALPVARFIGGAALAGVSRASERRRQDRGEILKCLALIAVPSPEKSPDSVTQANSRRATQRTARNLPP